MWNDRSWVLEPWRSTFLRGVEQRNTVETDCFTELYNAYSVAVHRLNTLAVIPSSPVSASSVTWTPVRFGRTVTTDESDSENSGRVDVPSIGGSVSDVQVPAVSGKARNAVVHSAGGPVSPLAGGFRKEDTSELQERNLVLRDQVRLLEANLRSADMEVKAAHMCLREAEGELKEKEQRVGELELLCRNLQQDITKLRATQKAYRRAPCGIPPSSVVIINGQDDEDTLVLQSSGTTTPRSAQGGQSVAMTTSSEEESHTIVRVDTGSTWTTRQQRVEIPNVSGRSFARDPVSIVTPTTPPTASSAGYPLVTDCSLSNETQFQKSRGGRSITHKPQRSHTVPNPTHFSQEALACQRTTFPLELITPRVRVAARPHSGAVTSLYFSTPASANRDTVFHDGLLVSGGYDGYVALLDSSVLGVKFSMRMAPNESAIVIVKISDDQERIVAACLDDVVYVASIQRQKTIAAFEGHQARIVSVGFLPLSSDQTNLGAPATHGAVSTAVPSTGKNVPNSSGMPSNTASPPPPPVSPHVARYIYSVSADRSIRIWDIERHRCVSTVRTANGITAATVAHAGRVLVLGHQNGCISLWQLVARDPPRKLDWMFRQMFMFKPLAPPLNSLHTTAIHEGSVLGLCFSTTGETLYSVGKEGRLAQLSVTRATTDGKSFRVPSGFRAPTAAGAMPATSPCGKFLALPSETGLTCWEVASGRCIASWGAVTAATCLVWKTSQALITGHSDGSLLVWCFT